MAEYDSVQRGSLKLKGVVDGGIKKKKKKKSKDKDKDAKKYLQQLEARTGSASEDEAGASSEVVIDRRTPAEIAFDKAKEEKEKKSLLQKANKTHKQRITDFNRHLDSLTEHFDIPKVSWTK